MRDPQAMDGLLASAVGAMGGIDILVLNYPGPALGLASEIDLEVMDAQYRLMVASPIRLLKAALGPMRERRFGRILAISGGSII
jgi:3-oxoacyl-[acyl-carrier protein] reductase